MLRLKLSRTLSRLLAALLVLVSIPSFANGFFPPEYKTFPFNEGDLLVSQQKNGTFSISKVLKIDKIDIHKGQPISIQGKRYVAAEDDSLLVVSSAYGAEKFNSFEAAKKAAIAGTWKIGVTHIPNRAPGAAAGQQLVSHAPVKDEELEDYKTWLDSFVKGEAGIF